MIQDNWNAAYTIKLVGEELLMIKKGLKCTSLWLKNYATLCVPFCTSCHTFSVYIALQVS